MINFTSESSAELKGLFKLESTSILIMERIEDVENAKSIYNSLKACQGIDCLAPRFDDGVAIRLDSLLPVLTFLHEQDHFKVLCSTPVGLLLWRIEQCLAVDASYLRRRLPTVTLKDFPTLLDAWAAASQGKKNVGPFAGTVKKTALGARIVRLFLQALLGRMNITIEQFVELANAAFQYLAMRSGLAIGNHARWTSDLDPAAPLLSPDQPTLMEILEASARARELSNLQVKRIDQATLEQWRERMIFGVYEPSFSYLMSELGSPVWAKTAIDLALGTPMDISAGKKGDLIRVEDTLPSYRLPKLVRALRNRTWNVNFVDVANQRELYAELPKAAGFASIPDLYKRLAKAKYSLEANWGGRIAVESGQGDRDEADTKLLNEFVEGYMGAERYLKFVEEQYRRNFKLRVQDPVHFITSQAGTLHEPILTFFKDHLKVTEEHLSGSPELAFAAFEQFCERLWGRSCVYGEEMVGLSLYRRLFRDWCVKVGMPESFVDGTLKMQQAIASKGFSGVSGEKFQRAFAKYASERSGENA